MYSGLYVRGIMVWGLVGVGWGRGGFGVMGG